LTAKQHDGDVPKLGVAREHREELAPGRDRGVRVQEDESWRLVHGPESVERGFAVGGVDHPETFGGESTSKEEREFLVLIDHEDQRASKA
jgi:hypothetical protein